jgi:serine/threonine protein kinase
VIALSTINSDDLFHHFDCALNSSDPLSYPKTASLPLELCQELNKLLALHCASPEFLENLEIPNEMLEKICEDGTRFLPGETFGDFEFIDKLGEGSFGVVYHARQVSLERDVALKVTPDFGEEAKTLARLEHDHIVPIFFQSRDEERQIRMICMPLLPGITLSGILESSKLLEVQHRNGSAMLKMVSMSRATHQVVEISALEYRSALQSASFTEACLMIMANVGDAVAYAHSQSTLHLDIKPENILFDIYGRPKLADFNVSVSNEERGRVLGGTKHYMSPEQELAMSGEASMVHEPSDVYSLGLVLQKCLEVEKSSEDFVPISRLLHASLAKDPKLRPTAKEFAGGLRNCLDYLRMRAALPPSYFGEPWVRRNLLLSIVFVALVPNIIGSIVNIRYNSLQIVSHLNESQSIAFKSLILGYNILVYPFAIVFLFSSIRRCIGSFYEFCEYKAASSMSAEDSCKYFADFGRTLIIVSSLGWLAGALVFPFGIDLLAGPLDGSIYLHFVISFVISWLIAMTYSYLGVQFVLTRTVYPEIMDPLQSKGFGTVRWPTIENTSRLMLVLAVFIPMIGAVMVLFVGLDHIDPKEFFLMKVLISSLITVGLAGFVISFFAFDRIKSCVAAMNRQSSHSK